MAEISAEKRILLAFGLSFVVLLAWWSFLGKRAPLPEPPPTQPPPEAAAPAPPTPTPPVVSPQEPVGLEVRQGVQEQFISVETDVATIVFSTRGAVVRSWRLKDYRDHNEEPVELVQAGQTRLGDPLSFQLGDAGREETLNSALYVVNAAGERLAAPAELVFEWSDGRLVARKRFRFERGYGVAVETRVAEAGQPLEHRLAWRGGFGEDENGELTNARLATGHLFVRTPSELKRHPSQRAEQETGWLWRTPSPFPYNGEAAYAGIEDQYFVALFLPRQPQLSLTAWTREWAVSGQETKLAVGALAVGTLDGEMELFVGPKAIDILEQVQPTPLASGVRPLLADELVDFGWFWWVAKPLFLAMKWMYQHWIPNYGWVIVLLTVVINVALFPLRWKSMQSSFRMQKVAPQIKAIQERYKQYRFNDPRKQEMQREIMAVYQQHGINPLGGCLPMLLQLPFFYGFYKVLALSIEMRHAPWVLWIRDLSQKDPYYVLPISMATAMYLSMKMTPMTGVDPRQQRLMQVMMLVFAFAFLQVSAGLVLYWLGSSVVGIGQQWWINRWQRQHEKTEKAAARERKKKKRKHSPVPPAGQANTEGSP